MVEPISWKKNDFFARCLGTQAPATWSLIQILTELLEWCNFFLCPFGFKAMPRVEKRVSERVLRRAMHIIWSETLGRRLASAKSLVKSLGWTLCETLGKILGETIRARQASPQRLGSDYMHSSFSYAGRHIKVELARRITQSLHVNLETVAWPKLDIYWTSRICANFRCYQYTPNVMSIGR